jgi:hypothetical protein
LAHDFWKSVRAKEQEREDGDHQDIGHGKHRGVGLLGDRATSAEPGGLTW